MKALLCTPDCGPLPLSDWTTLSDLRFDGIRTDVRVAAHAADIVVNVAVAGSDAIFIVDITEPTWEHTVDGIAFAAKPMGGAVAIEVGNEPDLNGWGKDPTGFGKLVAKAAERAWKISPDIHVVSGGIGNTSPDAIAWLGQAVRQMPLDVDVGFHPYRHKDSPPGIPRPGYSTREAEFKALRTAAQGRALWNTEIGWHTAPRGRDFPLCWMTRTWSDGEVAAFLREELRINKAQDVDCVCVFQINDGPNSSEREHHFGVRRLDGTLKPSAFVVREWRASGW